MLFKMHFFERPILRYFFERAVLNPFFEGAVLNHALSSASFGFVIVKLLLVVLSLLTRLYGLYDSMTLRLLTYGTFKMQVQNQ